MSGRWRRCCGAGCCASTAPSRRSASSCGSGYSRCRPGCWPRPWRCGSCCGPTMTATMDDATLRVLVWLVEGTWQGCVDAAWPLLPAGAEITLLHVTPDEVAEAAAGALAGLLGRGRPGPGRHPAERIGALSGQAASELLAAAAARLRHGLAPEVAVRQEARSGRVERVGVQTAEELAAGLLVAARDGDRSRLGPASLGPA